MAASSSSIPPEDKIRIEGLSLKVALGDGTRWPSPEGSTPKPQPILLTLTISHNCALTAKTDDLTHSINYGTVCAALIQSCETSPGFSTIETLADHIFDLGFTTFPAIRSLSLTLVKPKALLHARCVSFTSARARGGLLLGETIYAIEDLSLAVIVGVNQCEREEEQVVLFDISLARGSGSQESIDFRDLDRAVVDTVKSIDFQTLEALASSAAHSALRHVNDHAVRVTIRASKPSALLFAAAAQVELTRRLADFAPIHEALSTSTPASGPSTAPNSAPPPATTSALPEGTLRTLLDEVLVDDVDERRFGVLSARPQPIHMLMHTATIAFGSNLGDRFANIERALRLLERPADLLAASGTMPAGSLPDGGDADAEKEPWVVIVDTSFLYETAPMYVVDQPRFINCACMIETNLPPLALLRLLKNIESAVGRVPTMRNGPRAVDLDVLTYDADVIDTRPSEKRGADGLANLEGTLVVPHPRMAEREFVLRPLKDIVPEYVHPALGKTISTLLESLLRTQPSHDYPMFKVLPFPAYPLAPETRGSDSGSTPNHYPVPPTLTYWTFPLPSHPLSHPKARTSQAPRRHKTYVMATLNATPDSFSDGGLHATRPAALAYASESISAGADIIDVGGYSTRPGAQPVPIQQEEARVVPLIMALREAQAGRGQRVPISVDTFRAPVARKAVQGGASCINDVHAFAGGTQFGYPLTRAAARSFLAMRREARALAAPVVLMHSRGDAGANKDYSAFAGAAGGREESEEPVLTAIRAELGERVDCAVRGAGGLRRWMVLVDPGVGFSKSVADNLAVLRGAGALTADEARRSSVSADLIPRNPLSGFPQLVGASRKSFLGAVLEQPSSVSGGGEGGTEEGSGRKTNPEERGWATAAAVACAVQQGVQVVRVHDVQEMADVVKVADALWG